MIFFFTFVKRIVNINNANVKKQENSTIKKSLLIGILIFYYTRVSSITTRIKTFVV